MNVTGQVREGQSTLAIPDWEEPKDEKSYNFWKEESLLL